MARLRNGEKSWKTTRIERSLRQHMFGVRESELAEELGWERRTLSNYLRRLEHLGKAYKEGRNWFLED